MLLAAIILKALIEVALLVMVGQGLLYVVAGKSRPVAAGRGSGLEFMLA